MNVWHRCVCVNIHVCRQYTDVEEGYSKWTDLLRYEVSESLQRVDWRAAVLFSDPAAYFFLPKESSVTQEFRLCFYSLSYYVSNDLRHSVLSFSLFAALKQTNRAAQREAKSAPFLTPLTCSLRARSAVSCACAVFNDMISLFCHLNCSSGILLKMNLCTTLQVFLLHCGAIK